MLQLPFDALNATRICDSAVGSPRPTVRSSRRFSVRELSETRSGQMADVTLRDERNTDTKRNALCHTQEVSVLGRIEHMQKLGASFPVLVIECIDRQQRRVGPV